MNSNNNNIAIKREFDLLFQQNDTSKQIKQQEYLLMSFFLSEIEFFQKGKGITRKKLAKLIDTSPSYLTQVFRGDKPLNFRTIAKIQQELNIQFKIEAFDKEIIKYSSQKKTENTLNYYISIDSSFASQITKKDYEEISKIVQKSNPEVSLQGFLSKEANRTSFTLHEQEY